jgi:hypothetical protein
MVEAAAHMAARIAILEPPGKYLIQGRSGNHTELAKLRNCLRELPVGNAYSHAALNDRGITVHIP